MKYSKYISVILSSLALISCGGTTTEITREGESVTYTGTLKSLGEVMVESKADHILETYDGNIYYVYSQFLDLDKDKYKNANLQISGEIVTITESGKEIIAIESIVPLIGEVIEQDVKHDIVKKYQNLDLGFKLEDLVDFEVKEYINQVVFSKEQSSFKITRLDNKDSLTLDEWLNLSDKVNGTPVFIGHDRLKAYLYEFSNTKNTYFISRTNRYIYQVDLTFSDDESKNELKTILNSFRFVPLKDQVADNSESASNGNYSAIEIDTVKSYFGEHLAEIVPDYGGGEYSISRFEFLNTPDEGLPPDEAGYVYVAYESNEKFGRILTSYHFSQSKISDVMVEAIFKEGTVTDWEIVDGEDKIKGLSTLVIRESEDGDTSPIVLEEGYRLFESVPFHFSVQYPSNWYVQGQSGKYLFNDKPLKGNYLISIEVRKEKIADAMSDIPFSFEKTNLIPDKEAFISHPTDGDKYGVYLVMQRETEGETYVLWATSSEEERLMKMARSIVGN
ncbi:MAG: hypothetical protein Q8P68_03670 [Candidatus Peregrinibacteria bacterium]|nr:hypothetical protein [Candidatus Peregrinibacteria bacterium]MDZ4244743.1 hypothetical protein [Candidatus Gracilibacteria bacterium]